MENKVRCQWIGALCSEDLPLITAILADHPALANSLHEALDDPYRSRRFAVASLLFAAIGPPQQMIRWHQVRRAINHRIVHLLLAHGADPNIYSIHGRPLCWVRDRATAERLIEAGGNINLWHDNGGSPLNFSVWQVDPERLQMQLDLGADPAICDPETGGNLLHALAQYARSGWARDEAAIESCLKLLVKAGVSSSHKNSAGKMPSDVARDRGDEILASWLDHPMAG